MTIYAHCRRKGKEQITCKCKWEQIKYKYKQKKIRRSSAWTTGQTIDPTPQGVIQECSLSGAGAKFVNSREVDG
jgi:hypothetical protein